VADVAEKFCFGVIQSCQGFRALALGFISLSIGNSGSDMSSKQFIEMLIRFIQSQSGANPANQKTNQLAFPSRKNWQD
jgi:hypothetical protein